LFAREGDERLDRRQFARGGDIADPVCPPRGKVRAQRGGIEPGERGPALRGRKRGQQARGGGEIGAHRMRGAAPRQRQVLAPGFEDVLRRHAATRLSGTSSPSSASSSGMPFPVTASRSPVSFSRPNPVERALGGHHEIAFGETEPRRQRLHVHAFGQPQAHQHGFGSLLRHAQRALFGKPCACASTALRKFSGLRWRTVATPPRRPCAPGPMPA
jgi:hypothetical protein